MTYFSAFPCLLGFTILLLQTIFVSKIAVNNEKWKAQNNSFDSFNSWSKKANLLPSFQGGAGGKLSYSLPFREGPGVGFSPREARLTHKMGVSGFQVQDTHNASCFTNMTWIGLNLSDWKFTQNTRLFHLTFE